MRKLILLSLCVSLSAYIVSACDSEHQSNTYELACLASGGTFQNNTCSCSGAQCEDGIICKEENGRKQCAVKSEDIVKDNAFELACKASNGTYQDNICYCSEEPCEKGIVCVEEDLRCGKKSEDIIIDNAFERACVASKGVYQDNICVCNHISCEKGMICINDGNQCAVNSEDIVKDNAFELACKASGGETAGKNRCQCGKDICSTGVVCKNEDDTIACAMTLVCNDSEIRCIHDNGIGRNQKCENGTWEFTTYCANNASCIFEDDGRSVCGECQNDNTSSCEMGEDNIGKHQICINGTWGDVTVCLNEASCTVSEDGTSNCGECQNGSITSCEMGQDNIGRYKLCNDGQYSEEVECENNASCMLSDDDVLICGECQNDAIRCSGEHEYQVCEDGRWTEESRQCAGNAICVDDVCDTTGLKDCNGDEIKCTEEDDGKAYYHQCIQGKFAVEECPKSNHCSDEYTCGECKAEDKPICENNDTGSHLISCNTDNYRWNTSYYSASCKNESEVGDCRNGYYKFDYSVTHPPIIQRCVKGKWPIKEDTIQSNSWPNNSLNDSLFAHIISIDNDRMSFTSNYLRYLHIYITSSTFNFNSLQDEYRLSSLKDYFQWTISDNNSKCSNNYFYGYQGSCPTLGEFIKVFYDDSDIIKNWFSCTEDDCSSLSFCIDAITTGILSENITPDPYIFTFNDNNGTMTMRIDKADNVCNSNRTAAKGECQSNAIDMTIYDMLPFINMESDSKTNNVFDESTDINTQICRFGISRNIQCNKKINDDGVFACKFDEISGSQRFDSDSLCIDFYDPNYQHVAYSFKNISIQNSATASFVESTPSSSSMVYMIKCDSNLCNKDWTDCLYIE